MNHDDPTDRTSSTLVSPDGRLRATLHPTLNMLVSSLLHDGEELLHLRAGVAAYAERGKTCGIPLLHPWANRLCGDRYEVNGQVVVLSERGRPLTRDANGLPNHGLLGGPSTWDVVSGQATGNAATLTARFDFSSPDLLANFPFPHTLEMRVVVSNDSVAVTVILTPTSSRPVPVSFGFHPYLRLPGVPREQWILSLPVRRRFVLDDHSIPTGEMEDVDIPPAPLADRTFDDGFTGITSPRVFAIEGGTRRIEVEFGESYPVAQVFAPAGSDFVCIEPMTAAANALVRGGSGLPMVCAGSSFEATFEIRCLRAGTLA